MATKSTDKTNRWRCPQWQSQMENEQQRRRQKTDGDIFSLRLLRRHLCPAMVNCGSFWSVCGPLCPLWELVIMLCTAIQIHHILQIVGLTASLKNHTIHGPNISTHYDLM